MTIPDQIAEVRTDIDIVATVRGLMIKPGCNCYFCSGGLGYLWHHTKESEENK